MAVNTTDTLRRATAETLTCRKRSLDTERKWEESVPERTEFWRRKEDNPWILLAI